MHLQAHTPHNTHPSFVHLHLKNRNAAAAYLHNISDVRMYISMPVDVSNAHIHKRSLKHRDTDSAALALTNS